jgi:glutathione S-transferase
MPYLAAALGLIGAGLIWFLIEKARRRTRPVAGGPAATSGLPHEAAFELYGNAFSHCSRKTRLVFHELGIPFRHRHVDLIETGGYGGLRASYLRINPSGLIPTLVHDGRAVYESDDIMAYVIGLAPAGAPSLAPADEAGAEQMRQWVAFGSLSSDQPMGDMERRMGACVPGLTLPLFMTSIAYISPLRILEGVLFHPDRARPVFFMLARLRGIRAMLQVPRLAKGIAASRTFMRAHLLRLEGHLRAQSGEWMMGDQYTLADISIACILERLREGGWLDYFSRTEDLQAVLAYFDRVRARPAWAAAIDNVRHPIIDRGIGDLSRLVGSDKGVAAVLQP